MVWAFGFKTAFAAHLAVFLYRATQRRDWVIALVEDVGLILGGGVHLYIDCVRCGTGPLRNALLNNY
ncbi:MAG TPA: hypothetical protein DCL40_01695 [Coxiellaceae bacterium]|nr:hypothetical protein [Coxiellaceae bacterium]|tara:strand:- start:685 stop:885 length:201 start_codon:yes stop_codon:yes gene_type:complete